jgi:hypothetical protein
MLWPFPSPRRLAVFCLAWVLWLVHGALPKTNQKGKEQEQSEKVKYEI